MRPAMSDDFAVRCKGCAFTWHSPAMADGLRVLGACPKCKGELEFAEQADAAADVPTVRATGAEPHMVLGIPRI